MLRIRKLRHKTLQEGYIYASAFECVDIKKFYLCIWDSYYNAKSRVHLVVQPIEYENGMIAQYALVLKFSQESFYEKNKKYLLRFSKTSEVFDREGFFWIGAKGSSFKVQTKEIEKNLGIFFLSKAIKNQNISFVSLLKMASEFSNQEAISLESFLKQKWEVHKKGTYSFAIYLHTYLQLDKICFGDSVEMVYRFDPGKSLPEKDFSVDTILYEYKPNRLSAKKKPRQKEIPEKKSVSLPYEYQNQESSSVKFYSMDQEILQQKGYDPRQGNFMLDIKLILKESVQGFIKKFQDKNPQDENYDDLAEEILQKLEILST
ncbi:MAG: hypothetical protein HUU50_08155 [Candidatus Brocadiae bacterium]|nr:hypothetical protein [Candidatus Brocadiia bacterium]